MALALALASKTSGLGLGLGLDHAVLEHIPGFVVQYNKRVDVLAFFTSPMCVVSLSDM